VLTRIAPLLLLLGACASASHDAQTVHSADATRVWSFQQDADGNPFVLYCDSNWAAKGHPLCIRYSNAESADPRAAAGRRWRPDDDGF
jgi:hypothetical protein